MKTPYKSTSCVTEGILVTFDRPILCHQCGKALNKSEDLVYKTIQVSGHKYVNVAMCKKCYKESMKGVK